MVARSEKSEWLTPAELAVRFRISEDTARRIIHIHPGSVPAGKIPGIRLGRQFRVHVEDVERYEARETPLRAERPARALRRSLSGKDYFRD